MHWIEIKLKELKKSKRELATALDLPSSRITDIVQNRRNIQAKEVIPLAVFLKMRPIIILALCMPDGTEPFDEFLKDEMMAKSDQEKSNFL